MYDNTEFILDEERWERWLLEVGFQPHYSRADEFIRSDCPFCGSGSDKAHRVMASVAGMVNCYSCGSGYGAVRFVMQEEGATRAVAESLLCSDGYMEDIDEVFVPKPPPKRTSGLIPLDFQHRPLVPDMALYQWEVNALEALYKRGFPFEFLIQTGVGFGLHSPHSRWSNRVTLPVYEDGVCVWAQAWDWTKQSDIKYQSPKRDEATPRSRVIYWPHMLKIPAKRLVVLEGVFNAWAALQAGDCAVATFGKGLSDEQFSRILRSAAEEIVIAYDHDALEVAHGIAGRLFEYGKTARVIEFPDDRDLNDYSVEDRVSLLSSAELS